MKFSNQFLPHVIVLVLIIIAALVCFIPCVVPYAKPSSGFAVYEGMDGEVMSEDPNQGMDKLKEEAEKGNVAASGQSVAPPVTDAPAPASTESFLGLGSVLGGNSTASSVSVDSFVEGNSLSNISVGSIFGGNSVSSSVSAGNTAVKRESFQPLEYAPVGNYSEIIDKFSQVNTFGQDGVNGCTSSGLSNSKGYLCLTPDLISALKTRGGNAQG